MVSKILKDVENSGAKGWIAEAYANGIAYSDADARDYVASVADKDLLEKTFVDYFLSRHVYVKGFFIIRKIFWIRQRRSIFILMIWRPAGHFVRNGRIWMMWQ